MSETKPNYDVNADLADQSAVKAAEIDPFASLNKMLEESPEFKSIFDSVMSVLGNDAADEEDVELEYVEIDGHDYIIGRRIEIAGTTYLYLVNEDDIMDFVIQKLVLEDGEEHVTSLDSDKEFDLVQAYFQRDLFMQLKEKLRKDSEDEPNNS